MKEAGCQSPEPAHGARLGQFALDLRQ
jgi:hypothetical protein